MKANELRLGNWVSSKYHKGLQTEIFAIQSHDYIRLGCNPLPNYTMKDIKPIKISKEWLLKLGFKVCDMDGFYIYTTEFVKIEFNSLLYCWVGGTKMNLKYIHQIQNLYFALTQRELKVS